MQIIYVGLGGFIGASLRFVISRYLGGLVPSFPLGTLTVNILGSLVLGFIMYSITLGKNISPEMRDFITIGIIGGFTTMSSFAYESFRLFELKEFLYFGLNLFFNIFFSLIAVYLGKLLAVIINK